MHFFKTQAEEDAWELEEQEYDRKWEAEKKLREEKEQKRAVNGTPQVAPVQPPPEPTPIPAVAPETDKGAQARYQARVELFEKDGDAAPQLRHALFWALHNCLAHPLLGAFPSQKTVEVHELTSTWLNHEHSLSKYPMAKRVLDAHVPEVTNRGLWLLHNCVAHPLIGLFPRKTMFDLHDWSARLMQVPGWV